MSIIQRRILQLCRAIEGAARADILRLFAEHEADAVVAEIDAMVTAGLLVERGGRLYLGAP